MKAHRLLSYNNYHYPADLVILLQVLPYGSGSVQGNDSCTLIGLRVSPQGQNRAGKPQRQYHFKASKSALVIATLYKILEFGCTAFKY